MLLTGRGETLDVITGELGAPPGPGAVLTMGVGEFCPDIEDILPCSFTMGSGKNKWQNKHKIKGTKLCLKLPLWIGNLLNLTSLHECIFSHYSIYPPLLLSLRHLELAPSIYTIFL